MLMSTAFSIFSLLIGFGGFSFGVWKHFDANRESLTVDKAIESSVNHKEPLLRVRIVNRSKIDLYLKEVKVVGFVHGAFGRSEMAIPCRTRGFDDNRPLPPRSERTFCAPMRGAGSIEPLAKADVRGQLALIIESTLGRVYECEDDKFNTLINSCYLPPQGPPNP